MAGPSRVTGSGGSSTGAMSMRPCQFGQSRFLTTMAIGPPIVLPVPHPGHDLDAVAFDLLPTTPSVALLAPLQVDIDVFGQHGQARRQVLHEDRQLRTVRLTSGEYAEHAQAHTPILSATAP